MDIYDKKLGFPCGSAGKEYACNAGDLGLIPGLGRSLGEGNSYPLQYSCLENSMICIVHGILQAGILEWVGMPSFRGSSQPRDQTQVSHTAGGFLTISSLKLHLKSHSRGFQSPPGSPQHSLHEVEIVPSPPPVGALRSISARRARVCGFETDA